MNAMFKRYDELMSALDTLPDNVAEHEAALRSAQSYLRQAEMELDLEEARLALVVEGKNAEERKARLVGAKHTDYGYQRKLKAVKDAQKALDDIEVDLESTRKRFMAVCYQAQLCAAYLPAASVWAMNPSSNQKQAKSLSAQDVEEALGL